MSEDPSSVSERMREEWNARAREDAHYYVAFGGRGQAEEDFDATAADVLRLLESNLPRIACDPKRRALEIGCGPGRLMKPLSRHFGEIHGVDVSDEMIRIARERLQAIPHAHAHATDGASLGRFPDRYFDFVYSYAVFQHIPSRDVVFEYMRETCRVLKSGGIFVGQFNGLPASDTPDTWGGVSFTAADIRDFTRAQGLRLMSLERAGTQYMWTTWQKPAPPAPAPSSGPPHIQRLTNAYTSEPIIPSRGRNAAVSLQVANLPEDCDLNNLEVLADGAPCTVLYIAPRGAQNVQQVNAWLPAQIRTGLVPIQLRRNGGALCSPRSARIVPPGPLVPRLVSITDGINLSQLNRITTGVLKIALEEVNAPGSIHAAIAGRTLERVAILCVDPVPPRYEVNFKLPGDLPPGGYVLEVQVGARKLLPAMIEVNS